MVYITFPTEYGTLYSARELDEIFEVCRRYKLPLYVDGARLGYGLMAEGNDITLPYLAKHCDVFYIGGTKIGALCGEAVVFTHNNAHEHFFNIQKQHGALMAKGRLLGVQFDALFTDNLYFDISRHANDMAMRMKRIFQAKASASSSTRPPISSSSFSATRPSSSCAGKTSSSRIGGLTTRKT